jgi:hypothetical protein
MNMQLTLFHSFHQIKVEVFCRRDSKEVHILEMESPVSVYSNWIEAVREGILLKLRENPLFANDFAWFLYGRDGTITRYQGLGVFHAVQIHDPKLHKPFLKMIMARSTVQA